MSVCMPLRRRKKWTRSNQRLGFLYHANRIYCAANIQAVPRSNKLGAAQKNTQNLDFRAQSIPILSVPKMGPSEDTWKTFLELAFRVRLEARISMTQERSSRLKMIYCGYTSAENMKFNAELFSDGFSQTFGQIVRSGTRLGIHHPTPGENKFSFS